VLPHAKHLEAHPQVVAPIVILPLSGNHENLSHKLFDIAVTVKTSD